MQHNHVCSRYIRNSVVGDLRTAQGLDVETELDFKGDLYRQY